MELRDIEIFLTLAEELHFGRTAARLHISQARVSQAITVTEFHFSDPFTALRGGQVDIQLMWLPIREPDLTHGPCLLTEGRVLAVPSTSPPARRGSVSMEDLGDHVVFDARPEIPGYWFEAMLPGTPRRDARSGVGLPAGPFTKSSVW
ncbi:LysR family transcriptional regulator [Hamadaea tsunoensis]|uniref:LysR family transcriptional regulator n=1 Tax=Hamadaea tsunoensis TaxID=53368 RepID=UPI000428BD8E|nr:LysR family transcriptional regulator [Hamadaea tsunoensis]